MKGNKDDGANVTSDTPYSNNNSRIPSGFPIYRSRMVVGFVLLTIVYFVVIACFDSIQKIAQLPPSAKEFCQSQQQNDAIVETAPCWRADLFSFEVVSGLALIWCGCKGFYVWHVKKIQQSIPATPEGRLFSYIEDGHSLTAVSTTFQLFDLAVSLLIPEQRQFLFLCHHIMAATVSWYGLNNQVSMDEPCHHHYGY
jgi:hypothetical protein